MTVPESLQRFGLVPSDNDLPFVRALLAQEACAERDGSGREEDLALLCAVQLFARGMLEDVLRIWDAKQSGFDLACYLDVQLLCGAGLGATKEFLATQVSPSADLAFDYIGKCEVTGDFEGFTPQGYLDGWRRYFSEE